MNRPGRSTDEKGEADLFGTPFIANGVFFRPASNEETTTNLNSII
jgi:hypothetical protein